MNKQTVSKGKKRTKPFSGGKKKCIKREQPRHEQAQGSLPDWMVV